MQAAEVVSWLTHSTIGRATSLINLQTTLTPDINRTAPTMQPTDLPTPLVTPTLPAAAPQLILLPSKPLPSPSLSMLCQASSSSTPVESSALPHAVPALTTPSTSSDMELPAVSFTGSSETHGAPHGVRLDISASSDQQPQATEYVDSSPCLHTHSLTEQHEG
jgi:hypothetical protein